MRIKRIAGAAVALLVEDRQIRKQEYVVANGATDCFGGSHQGRGARRLALLGSDPRQRLYVRRGRSPIVEVLGQPESLFEYVGGVVAVVPEPAVEAYAQ